MKVLAFDIGIQNLAYCYFTITPKSNNLFTIHDWNVITLSNDICQHVNRKVCDKIAKFRDEEKQFCNKHKTKQSKKIKENLIDLHTCLVRQLDNVECDPDYIVIENQPKFNPKMKTIAAAIYTYYAIRHKVDKETSLRDISYIHPNYKITKVPYNGPELENLPKAKYAKYKKMGIEYTKYFLRNHGDQLEHFNTHSKKDDLADSFLNGFAYIMVMLSNKKVSELMDEYDVKGTREEILDLLIRRIC